MSNDGNILHESRKPVAITRTIRLFVQIRTKTEAVSFLVPEKFAVVVLLGFDSFDKHVEALKQRLKNFELDHGTTVPIVHQRAK